MNPACAEAAAAKKSRHKDKKQKKSKRKETAEHLGGEPATAEEEAVHKKKKKKKHAKEEGKADPKRRPTVSIAVAGSVIDNAQSLELATLLAGQIARAAAVFRIDEIVVFDSSPAAENGGGGAEEEEESGARFLVRILEYLETPQYLRRRLFPMHKNFKYVGLLPPLDAPHHVRKHEWSEFREGVTLGGDRSKGTPVDVGLSQNILVEQILEQGKRVTVAMGTNRDLTPACVRKVVPPSSPSEEMGSYWGYKVRYASNLSGVINDSPYKEGYDHIIGTSEHGETIISSELILPSFRHLLIAFGGLAGLEESIEEDPNLNGKGANDVFPSYLNTCPNQGSRTIRTEEALLISLQYFQDPIRRAGMAS
ncbi:hypothetical protein CFC21_074531 [Triticum aestivum]|uniref:Uncharacterized protein n=2 Tax=Triticum aestivum TaxID=4565 RepID=A0A3B6LVC4_WHEAT|nr:putative methyltransferase C9orf114 [Triticum dicoccoides]XP_044391312.1 putative methyltransferase C9orf114 [Triticum aestivum]KAF7068806.1 hypothetical protein CFC21_074531 [Triticum aestivum]